MYRFRTLRVICCHLPSRRVAWLARTMFVLIALALPYRAGAVPLVIDPETLSGSVGDTISIDLDVSELVDGAAPSLGAFDLDLFFDASVLQFDSIQWGSGLDVLSLGTVQSVTSGVGILNLFELSLDTAADLNTLQPDAFRLATIRFIAIGDGLSALTLVVNAFADADGNALPVTTSPGSVEIATVPEPASMTLLLLGLSSVGLRRMMRRGPERQ